MFKLLTLFLLSLPALANTWPPNSSVNSAITALPGQKIQCNTAGPSQFGCLLASDWTIFNNKLDASRSNYITNSDAEVNTNGWNLYSFTGRTTPASGVNQDITFTSTLSGDAGNGATITYGFSVASYLTPTVTCPTGSSVLVTWYNGPTVANNPTATQLKAAYDATPCAVAIATSAITGTATNLQYEATGTTLLNGGNTSPVDGTGGSTVDVTFTRNTSTPLAGIASFDLGKDTNSAEGTGVSTDFTIFAVDKGQQLQISFAYEGSSGMVLGSSSDVKVFLYDIADAVLIPVTPINTIAGPVSTIKTFVGQFTATQTSANYRLILHIATPSTSAWDLLLDNVVVNSVLNATAATQVPSVVLPAEPISGAVTDHMVVMWQDASTQWVPATIAGAANPVYGTDRTMLGFATNIIGGVADIYIHGYMGGFSFGPFLGYEQYIDNIAGGISPLPSPFTDTYVRVGKGVSTTGLNIDFSSHLNLITAKGGLLAWDAANDGTGDVNLAVGANGNALIANSAAATGLSWSPAVVASAPFTYTTSTRTLTAATATNAVAGFLSAADHTSYSAVTGAVTSMAAIGATPNANGGSIAANALTLQPASASFGGLVTTGAQTFAGVKTLPSPVFTTQTTLPAINLVNGATNGTNTVLVYKNGHIKSTITTAPTAAPSANAGTSATCTLSNATDSAGIVNLTEGSAAWASGTQCTITFNAAYGVAPICVWAQNNALAAAHTVSQQINFTTTTTTMLVSFGAADTAANAYKLMYNCVETQ